MRYDIKLNPRRYRYSYRPPGLITHRAEKLNTT
ncbi:hypothetical protein RSAG8_08800, partial [Rhizoctonia solani AG-8 WAC10335]